MLGFDQQMNRIGYGGGFYDRTLTPKMIKIGIAFEYAKMELIPTTELDIKMDFIVTEKQIY